MCSLMKLEQTFKSTCPSYVLQHSVFMINIFVTIRAHDAAMKRLIVVESNMPKIHCLSIEIDAYCTIGKQVFISISCVAHWHNTVLLIER